MDQENVLSAVRRNGSWNGVSIVRQKGKSIPLPFSFFKTGNSKAIEPCRSLAGTPAF